MKFYFVKISCPNKSDDNHFGNIVERLFKHEPFKETLTNIPNKLNEAEINDLIFLQIGGDSGRKRSYFQEEDLQNFTNGLYGIGKLTQIDSINNKITADFYGFSKPITKTNLYFYPQFIDNLGASTKGIPNQAGLYSLSDETALSFIDFLKVNHLEGLSAEIISKIDSDDKLLNTSINHFYQVDDFNIKSTLSLLTNFSKKPLGRNGDHNLQKFEISKFISDLNKTGLVFNDSLIYRFISSLQSKRFLLLTGLSGSGKTKLAQSFAKWITSKNNSLYTLLKEVLKNDTITSNYNVLSVSPKTIELVNIAGSTGKIIPIPTEAVYEWYNFFIAGKITESDDPKEIRHLINENSKFQKYIHGFYNEFFKISALMYKKANMIMNEELNQYKIVSVGADWTNRDPLIGFPNSIKSNEYIFPDTGILQLILEANENTQLPYFIILDEMNMSYVERYFADFLSSMESSEEIQLHDNNDLNDLLPKSLKLPKNLFIIGTVNVDETTYMFSPKVLDRANVIEFRVSEEEMEKFLSNNNEINLEILDGAGASMGQSFVKKAKEFAHDTGKLKEELMPFFRKLQEAGAEFGFRTAAEISTFVKKCTDLANGEMSRDEIVDAAIMQKLLPKLHGSRNKIELILKDLGNLCLKDPSLNNFPESNADNIKYPVSYEKLKRMYRRVISDGFTSYAEA